MPSSSARRLGEKVWTGWKSIRWGAWSCMIDCREATRVLELTKQPIGIAAYFGLQNNRMCERRGADIIDTSKAIDERKGLID